MTKEIKEEVKIVKKAKKELVIEGYDKNRSYNITEAIKFAKLLGKEKFDSSMEIHFHLGIDPKKGDQQIRGAISLPHGTGKTVRVAAFVEDAKIAEAKAAGADLAGADDLIEEIKKTEKTDFDIAVTEPSMIKKMAMIAKILGTRGLMPTPKNETVTHDPIKAIKELKKGKVSFKNDDTANIHVMIGKKSFEDTKLAENFTALLDAIKKAKPNSSKGTYLKSVTIASSMGKGVKISLGN